MVQIKILKGHCLGGGRDVYPDAVLSVPGDLSFEAAQAKVQKGYAEWVGVPQAEAPAPPPPAVEAAPEEEKEAAPEEEQETDEEGGVATRTTAPGEISTGDPASEDRDPVVMAAAAKRAADKKAADKKAADKKAADKKTAGKK